MLDIMRLITRFLKRLTNKLPVLIVILVLLSSLLVLTSLPVQAQSSIQSDSDFNTVARNIVEQVGGLNLSSHSNITITGSYGPETPKSWHDVGMAEVSWDNNINNSIQLSFVGHQLYHYSQYYVPSNHTVESTEEYLRIAYRTLIAYGNLFNDTESPEAASMISAAIQGQNLTVENNDSLLMIGTIGTNWTDFNSRPINWYKKLTDNSATTYQSIYMLLHVDGSLRDLVDNIPMWKIGTTNLNVSREQAINLARPIAEAYAKDIGVNVSFAETELSWQADENQTHGNNSLAIYPIWVVSSHFSEKKDYAIGYHVALWADTGQVLDEGPIAFYTKAEDGNASIYTWILIATVATIVTVTCFGTYLKRKNRKRNLK